MHHPSVSLSTWLVGLSLLSVSFAAPTDAAAEGPCRALSTAAVSGIADEPATAGSTHVAVRVLPAVLVQVDQHGTPTRVATNSGTAPSCTGAGWLIWSPETSTSSPAPLGLVNAVMDRLDKTSNWSSRSWHPLTADH